MVISSFFVLIRNTSTRSEISKKHEAERKEIKGRIKREIIIRFIERIIPRWVFIGVICNRLNNPLE